MRTKPTLCYNCLIVVPYFIILLLYTVCTVSFFFLTLYLLVGIQVSFKRNLPRKSGNRQHSICVLTNTWQLGWQINPPDLEWLLSMRACRYCAPKWYFLGNLGKSYTRVTVFPYSYKTNLNWQSFSPQGECTDVSKSSNVDCKKLFAGNVKKFLLPLA